MTHASGWPAEILPDNDPPPERDTAARERLEWEARAAQAGCMVCGLDEFTMSASAVHTAIGHYTTLNWAWSIRADGVVRGQFPGASTNPVHEADVAAVATIALRTEDHLGATYHLTGPAAITQLEEMQQIGDAIGRTLRFEEQTSEQARAQLAGFTSPAMVEAIIGYYSAAAESGEPAPVVPTIEQITGRPARTFAEWAREHADDFR